MLEIGKEKQVRKPIAKSVLSFCDRTDSPSAPFPADEFRQELSEAVEADRRAKQAATQAAIAEAKKRSVEPNLQDGTNCPKCGCGIYQWTPHGKICRDCGPFTTAQLACLAVEAMEDTPMSQLIDSQPPTKNEAKADAKTAAAFNTNRTYVNHAFRLGTMGTIFKTLGNRFFARLPDFSRHGSPNEAPQLPLGAAGRCTAPHAGNPLDHKVSRRNGNNLGTMVFL